MSLVTPLFHEIGIGMFQSMFGGPPESPPGIDYYLDAAIDAYTQGVGDDWTTDGADADSGNLTLWPSMNGVLADITPTGSAAECAVITGQGLLRAVQAKAQLKSLGTMPTLPGAVMVVWKPFSSDTYVRLVGATAGYAATTGLFLYPSTQFPSNPPRFNLELQTANEAASWNDSRFTYPARNGQWWATALLLPAEGDPVLVTNGVEVEHRIASAYTPPAALYNGIGHTNNFDNFYVGEWVFFDDPSVEQLKVWTTEAAARWNGA